MFLLRYREHLRSKLKVKIKKKKKLTHPKENALPLSVAIRNKNVLYQRIYSNKRLMKLTQTCTTMMGALPHNRLIDHIPLHLIREYGKQNIFVWWKKHYKYEKFENQPKIGNLLPNLVASKAFLAIDSGAAHRKPGSLVENRKTTFRRGESKFSASNGYFPSIQIVTKGGKWLI